MCIEMLPQHINTWNRSDTDIHQHLIYVLRYICTQICMYSDIYKTWLCSDMGEKYVLKCIWSVHEYMCFSTHHHLINIWYRYISAPHIYTQTYMKHACAQILIRSISMHVLLNTWLQHAATRCSMLQHIAAHCNSSVWGVTQQMCFWTRDSEFWFVLILFLNPRDVEGMFPHPLWQIPLILLHPRNPSNPETQILYLSREIPKIWVSDTLEGIFPRTLPNPSTLHTVFPPALHSAPYAFCKFFFMMSNSFFSSSGRGRCIAEVLQTLWLPLVFGLSLSLCICMYV